MQPQDATQAAAKEGIAPHLDTARAGSAEALGHVLEMCRLYLLGVAGGELESRLQPKAGASDLVQETFLEAQRIFARFDGKSPEELLAWLRGILLNKLAEFTRRYRGTEKRQVSREVPLDLPADASGASNDVAGAAGTPSEALMRDEEAQRVRAALSRLPEHYRQVIVWRQWEDLAFGEIARRLGKTEDAARMLFARAIEQLEKELDASP